MDMKQNEYGDQQAPPSSTRSVPVDKHLAIGFVISKLIS